MKNPKHGIAVKTTALVEQNAYLAGLLAVLCLLFVVNFFLAGPGSDGGSGLGGTGKFGGGAGGESGLGGTGKAPDPGSAFKLGAADTDHEPRTEKDSLFLGSDFNTTNSAELLAAQPPEFDVDSLRLSLGDPASADAAASSLPGEPVLAPEKIAAANREVAELVATVNLPDTAATSQAYSAQVAEITADTLVDSLEILNSLMLAEAETSLDISARENLDAAQSMTRQRLAIPIRPERPDRFTVPARITPVQRVNIPSAPPVRPMRTLSTLLNK